MNDRDASSERAPAPSTPRPAEEAAPRGSRLRGTAWAFAPALILGGGLAGLGVMTALAIDDPSFALEPNYYQKAVELDAEKRQEAQHRELGWTLEVGPAPIGGRDGAVDLSVTLAGPAGALDDADVQIEAFHNARAAEIRQVTLEGAGEGVYRARLTDVRPGLWEFRFVVERQGIRFTDVQRHVLQVGGKS